MEKEGKREQENEENYGEQEQKTRQAGMSETLESSGVRKALKQ